jgi:hypothetical protein
MYVFDFEDFKRWHSSTIKQSILPIFKSLNFFNTLPVSDALKY